MLLRHDVRLDLRISFFGCLGGIVVLGAEDFLRIGTEHRGRLQQHYSNDMSASAGASGTPGTTGCLGDLRTSQRKERLILRFLCA